LNGRQTVGAHFVQQVASQIGYLRTLICALGETHIHRLQQSEPQQADSQYQDRYHHLDQSEARGAMREGQTPITCMCFH
jgi:hypothetical protein